MNASKAISIKPRVAGAPQLLRDGLSARDIFVTATRLRIGIMRRIFNFGKVVSTRLMLPRAPFHAVNGACFMNRDKTDARACGFTLRLRDTPATTGMTGRGSQSIRACHSPAGSPARGDSATVEIQAFSKGLTH